MKKVIFEREGYRFVDAGILEINGLTDYRMQKKNEYTKHWYDIYLFDALWSITFYIYIITYLPCFIVITAWYFRRTKPVLSLL